MTPKTKDEIRAIILRLLGEIAPEADLTALRPDVRLRDQLDLDSMDFLNFLIALDAELNISIPEEDYEKLATLSQCLDYLAQHLMVTDAPARHG